jgi:hypothetical protein
MNVLNRENVRFAAPAVDRRTFKATNVFETMLPGKRRACSHKPCEWVSSPFRLTVLELTRDHRLERLRGTCFPAGVVPLGAAALFADLFVQCLQTFAVHYFWSTSDFDGMVELVREIGRRNQDRLSWIDVDDKVARVRHQVKAGATLRLETRALLDVNGAVE